MSQNYKITKILFYLPKIKRRMTGLEPANNGTTIHCRNHLATPACQFNNNIYSY